MEITVILAVVQW